MQQETIRSIARGEHERLLELLDQEYGNFHSVSETKRQLDSRFFDSDDCFVAEQDHSIVGCIALTKLPRERWFVLRYLAVQNPQANWSIATRLIKKAVESAKSKRAEYVRSTTPRFEPYVTIYQQSGFEPVRRDFRIAWRIEKDYSVADKVVLEEVNDKTLDIASRVFIKSIADTWAWRTIEQGGEDNVINNFKDGFRKDQKWMLVIVDEKIVGLTGLIPNDSGLGNAKFRGAYVLPEYRKRGYGMKIMRATKHWASRLKQDLMTIYTFSPLDRLAPGAALYTKSGGLVESEYLQLQKQAP